MQVKKVILLFSGGQDSTLCLALALKNYEEVYTLGFDYGQNHVCEIAARSTVLHHIRNLFPNWSLRLKEDLVLPLRMLADLAPCTLTGAFELSSQKGVIPSTFVPGRNLLFFLYAAIWGYHLEAYALMGGMCEVDYSGYPDCRLETLSTLATSMQQGFLKPFKIETPLMHLTKAQSWHLAQEQFGSAFVELMREHTHTCYQGVRSHPYPWGYGCGTCDACILRAKGYEEYTMTSK